MEEDKLEEIIEEKVQERVKKEVDRKLKDKKQEEDYDKEDKALNTGEVSRRDFLKKMGTGAVGAGALALIPSASAFNIRTSNPLQYFNSSNPSEPNFKVDPSGDITGGKANVTELVADRVKANNEFLLPNKSASGDNKVWVNETADRSELKVRLNGEVKTLSASYEVPSSGILRWVFEDETDKTTTVDVWNNRDGSISKASYQTSNSAVGNKSLQFDVNTSQGVNRDSSLSISNEKSISAWIKISDNDAGQRLWDAGGQNRNAVHIASGSSYGAVSSDEIGLWDSSNSTAITTSVTYGSWIMYTATYDGSKWRFYENDSLIGSDSNITTTSIDQFLLGNDEGNNYPLNGNVDDLRIYNKQLTTTEISNLYSTGSISG